MQNLYNFGEKLNSKISEFIKFGRFKIKATNSKILTQIHKYSLNNITNFLKAQ